MLRLCLLSAGPSFTEFFMWLAEPKSAPSIEEERVVLVDAYFLFEYQHYAMHSRLAVLQEEDGDRTLSFSPRPQLNDQLGMLSKVAQHLGISYPVLKHPAFPIALELFQDLVCGLAR